jgi:GMP synthase-like glutamine amidotransferase
MKACIIQHIEEEKGGEIKNWLEKNKWEIDILRLYAEEKPNKNNIYDLIVIMGGPMSIYDDHKYPFLQEEKKWLLDVIKNHHHTKLLGICLGAQLLAFLLGGKVYKNKYPEIGWYPIEIDNKEKIFKNIPKEIMAFHYHGDTFSIPDGGKRIATNIHTENQAFSYKDRIFGFQFHLEMTETIIKEILEKYYDFVPEQEKAVQNKKEILNYTKKYLPETKKILFTILENLTLL